MADRKEAKKAKPSEGRTPCSHKETKGTLWVLEDPAHRRYRCSRCQAMGYRRMGARTGVRGYKCRAKDCKAAAVKRGWKNLLEVFWCAEHTPAD